MQSQVLYGQTVVIMEEKEDWFYVYVPEQPSSKLAKGYPGWLPKRQVTSKEAVALGKSFQSFAVVTAPTAWLYDGNEPVLEISFQTRLPVVSETDKWISVMTPHGNQKLKTTEAKVIPQGNGFDNATGDKLIEIGEAFLGLPYLWGGMSGFGFDCSGLSYTLHRAFGITIPRDASDQSKEGKLVERVALQRGDLVFFAKEEGKGRVYHVGMYYGDGRMIHAPSAGKGIEIVSIDTTKYNKDFSGARRYYRT
ncbi:MAG: C40 family peptidase [Bacillus sp. (in: Bacteria)]|nr:C40 family peptidase [Bacillus sp. (in: firmicutes)]